MITELLMHLSGWDTVWYAHPGRWHPFKAGRWHVGFWTGPDDDLVCINKCASRSASEVNLSPGSHTVLGAVLKAMWLRWRGGNPLCPKCRHLVDEEEK